MRAISRRGSITCCKSPGSYPDWNSAMEKAGVLQKLKDARRCNERLE